MSERVSSTIIGVIFLCVGLIPFFIPSVALPFMYVGSVESEFKGGSLLFVGDIMLGRHVETLSDENDLGYPFLRTENILSSADVTVGNFEGVIPLKHKQTSVDSLAFSFKEDVMDVLKDAGFDSLSLANNHAYDFDEDGYMNTLIKCGSSGVSCNGHPYEIASSSLELHTIGETSVAIVYLHGVSTDPEDQILNILLRSAREQSELQFVYIHWGDEYKPEHSEEQMNLAHYLVDNGIDAVIGHHPHVVQDIEIYNDKPIFYSLGNFVFDQYFSEDVQKGLGIQIEITKNAVHYALIPFTSLDLPSQPRIMDLDEKDAFLGDLIIKSDHEIALSLMNAGFTLPRD